MNKKIILFILLLAFSNIYAKQQKIVSGKVLLNKQFKLGNIKVTAKKSKAIVNSNMEGEFSIACEKNEILIFSAPYFNSLRKSIKKVDTLTVNMTFKSSFFSKDEVKDLNFFRSEDLEAAIESIKNNTKDYSSYATIKDIIRHEFPSITIKENEFIIRGESRLASGSDAAIIVLNGVIISNDNVSDIQTSDILSIDVIAGTRAAIYGSRGSNGAIVVKTK